MKKGVFSSLLQLLYVSLGFCFLWVYSCDSSNNRTSTVQQSVVNHLLLQADSLSTEELMAALDSLRQEEQKDFFAQRLLALENDGRISELMPTLTIHQHFFKSQPAADATFAYYYAVHLQFEGQHDDADQQYLRAIELGRRYQDSVILVKGLDSRGGNLGVMGRFDDAIASKYQALNICEAIGDQNLAMYIQAFLANLYIKKQEYEKAIELSKTPLEYFRERGNKPMEAYILLFQANSYLDMQQLDQSIALHKQIQQIYSALGQPADMNEHLYHYSRVLIKKGNWQEALDSLTVARQRILASQDKQGLIFVNLAAAEALFNLNRLEEARSASEECLKQATTKKIFTVSAKATLLLSSINQKQGNHQQALDFLNQHLALKDSLFSQEKDRITKELSLKYETAQKEQQIAALQREITLANQRNGWIGGTLASLMFGILYIFRTRFLRKQQQLKANQLLAEAKTETMQQQIDFQKNELATHQTQLQNYTQLLISKNKQLAELSKLLEQTDASSEASPSAAQHEVDGLYNSVIHTDKDWELFQTYFNKVHPGFIAHIKQQLPDLTPAELRTILLDKMNLSLREHAEILGVSIDAVKKGRYRLRKKYGLQPEGEFSSLWK